MDESFLPEGFDPSDLELIDMPCEFYLEGRDDPIRCLVGIHVTREALQNEKGQEALMDMSLNYIMSKLNSRNELWAILPSKNGTRTVIVLDRVETFSVQSPFISSEWYAADATLGES